MSLIGLALALRLGPLGPSTLWFDDAWAALVVKSESLREFRLAAGTAPGFAAILRGWLEIVGFSELNAQLPALVFGVATPSLLYLVLVRAGAGRLGAAVGAAALATSAIHATYSTRVKQFTLDALVATVVLAAALWLLDDVRDRRRWIVYAAVGVVAFALSSPVVVPLTAGALLALGLLWREAEIGLRVAVPAVTTFFAFSGLWWWLVLRPRVNASLEDYWARFFVPLDEGPDKAASVAARGVSRAIAGTLPLETPLAAAVIAAAAALLLWRRPLLALLGLVPLAMALALTALHMAPLGTGRTDIYLYPGFAMVLAFAVREGLRLSRAAALVGLAVLAVAVAIGFTPARKYPNEDLRPLVAELEARAEPTEAVLLHPHASFPFGLYTSWPIRLVPDSFGTGFSVAVERPRVQMLRGLLSDDHRAAGTWRSTVRALGDTERPIWLVFSHTEDDAPAITQALARAGYVRELELALPRASVTHWLPAGQSLNRTRSSTQIALKPSRQVIFLPSSKVRP